MNTGKAMLVGAAIVAAGALIPSARADLIPLDSSFGPDTLIRDTTTGLEWLKVSVTSGLSYNQIGPQFGPGDRFFGFSSPNISQYCGLLTGYLGRCTFVSSDRATVLRAGKFIDLFGPTSVSDTMRVVTFDFSPDPGFSPPPPIAPSTVSLTGSYVEVVEASSGTVTVGDTQTFAFLPDRPAHFLLFRAPVPQPATWSLIVSGIAMLLGLHRTLSRVAEPRYPVLRRRREWPSVPA